MLMRTLPVVLYISAAAVCVCVCVCVCDLWADADRDTEAEEEAKQQQDSLCILIRVPFFGSQEAFTRRAGTSRISSVLAQILSKHNCTHTHTHTQTHTLTERNECDSGRWGNIGCGTRRLTAEQTEDEVAPLKRARNQSPDRCRHEKQHKYD